MNSYYKYMPGGPCTTNSQLQSFVNSTVKLLQELTGTSKACAPDIPVTAPPPAIICDLNQGAYAKSDGSAIVDPAPDKLIVGVSHDSILAGRPYPHGQPQENFPEFIYVWLLQAGAGDAPAVELPGSMILARKNGGDSSYQYDGTGKIRYVSITFKLPSGSQYYVPHSFSYIVTAYPPRSTKGYEFVSTCETAGALPPVPPSGSPIEANHYLVMKKS